MSRMFSGRINEFVLSVDIMDEDVFFELLRIIQAYVNEHLDIVYFSVLEETTIDDDKLGLRKLWSTRGGDISYTVDADGDYGSHSAYAFGEDKPIWVVSETRKPLTVADDFRDMWSAAANLPKYGGREQEDVHTSVMHPLRKENRLFGIVAFASEKYIEPTPASLEEVRTLAAVIARAHQMYEVRQAQRKNTDSAMEMLEEALETQEWKRLALPRIFVAYPGVERLDEEARIGHNAVIKTIRRVLGEFCDVVDAIFWEDITEAGSITAHVIRDIVNADFGLGYFSEPDADGRYVDNANVLFETGMMQALANSSNALLRAWLPIRERESPPIPFDIAAERILWVSRDEGEFDEAGFANALRDRMNTLLEMTKNGT